MTKIELILGGPPLTPERLEDERAEVQRVKLGHHECPRCHWGFFSDGVLKQHIAEKHN